jgi:hypothetical protein
MEKVFLKCPNSSEQHKLSSYSSNSVVRSGINSIDANYTPKEEHTEYDSAKPVLTPSVRDSDFLTLKSSTSNNPNESYKSNQSSKASKLSVEREKHVCCQLF